MLEILAKQLNHSLGQSVTQLNLSTFHYADVSIQYVTLVVRRLKQVINVRTNFIHLLSLFIPVDKRPSPSKNISKLHVILDAVL
jgi:hypothetical protein